MSKPITVTDEGLVARQKVRNWIYEAANLLAVFVDCIDRDPLAVQFFDLRLIPQARKLSAEGRKILGEE